MPPQYLYDISGIDFDQVMFDQQVVRDMNPQRGDMEQLNGITWCNADHGRIIGFKDIRDDEFWVPGHIPGRPLYPGVLMIEAGAQLASFYTRRFMGWSGFIGFGGVDEVKFRLPVSPNCRMHLLALKVWDRHRRVNCKVQGLVKGQICFEASITGTQF
jgi:3-hydroxyacyl-[acyl-carrier-protein] dehydratase